MEKETEARIREIVREEIEKQLKDENSDLRRAIRKGASEATARSMRGLSNA